MRTHQYWVYIVANKGNTVVYIGVTNDIERRLFEHRTGDSPSAFAWRYQCWKLVHLEEFNDIREAIRREKQLKNWKREWKDELIGTENPEWNELSAEWDCTGWYDPKDPPAGYYQQQLKENWGGPERDSGPGLLRDYSPE
jgi:putative endonuclease